MRYLNGFTLLEVLISLFLVSLVMLGLMTAQVKILRDARSLYYFQQARGLAEGMAEYIAGNQGDSSGYYAQWQELIHHQLPSSSGSITGQRPNLFIKIYWGGNRVCTQNHQGLAGCIIINV